MTSSSTKWAQLRGWLWATAREAAWAPLSLIAFYLIARSIRLYDLYPPLDMPTHFIGGVAVTYFLRSAIRHSQQIVGSIPAPIEVVLGVAAAGTTIILWEFYEYAYDFFFGTRMIRGLEDTLMDMFLGLLGALGFTFSHRRGR